MKRLLLTTVLVLGTSAWAGPQEDAKAAVARSDYAAALEITRPMAEKGVSWAQFHLGFMYERGQGVPQDYAEAVKWFNLAAS